MLMRASSFITVLILGFICKKLGLFKVKDGDVLSKIILNITMPATIVNGFQGVDITMDYAVCFAFGTFMSLVLVIAGYFLSKNKTKEERAMYLLNIPSFNCGTFAIPFLATAVSPANFVTLCFFDMGTSYMTMGFNPAVAGAAMTGETDVMANVKNVIKKIFTSVPILCYIGIATLTIFKVILPTQILQTCEFMAGANGFLSMLCIGILFDIQLPKNGIKNIFTMLFARYSIITFAAVCVWFFMPMSIEMRSAIILIMYAPVALSAPIFTIQCGVDGTQAAVSNSISIILSVLTLTFLLTVLPL